MNAVEKLEAAITKLEEIKAVGWPCAEYTRGAVRHIARNCDISCDDEDHYEGWDRYETAPALMVLIATIDAQLAILRHVLTHMRGDLGISTNRHVVALADAILGASDADVR